MGGGWLLVGIVCCVASHALSQDSETSESLNRQFESSAKLLRSSLDELVAPLTRLDIRFRTPVIRKAADSVTGIAKSFADVGRKLADGFESVASRRAESVEGVVETVSSPFEDMEKFFTDVAPEHVANLERLMGSESSGQFKRALDGVNKAAVASSQAVNQLALRAAGDSEVGPSLLKLRDQVKVLTRAVDSSTTDIKEANTQMELAGLLTTLVDIPFDPKVWFQFILFDVEVAGAVERYQNTVRNIHTDLAAAVRQLDIFSETKELQPLVDSNSDAFARVVNELKLRSDSDVAIIKQGYESIRTNMTNLMEKAGNQFYTEMHAAEDSLGTMFLAKNPFGMQCSLLYGPAISGSIVPLQSEVLTCLSRERLRLPRLGENVDKVLNLLQTNNGDFAADVASCTRFVLTAFNEQARNQARGCLEANVDELNQYGPVLGSELDQLQNVVQMEADASVFRANLCIKQSTSEAASLMRGIQQTIDKCAVTGM